MKQRQAPGFSILRILEELTAGNDRAVFRGSGTRTTAEELRLRVEAVRGSLRQAGLNKADIVAISGERCPEAIATVLACWAEELIPFPLDYRQDTAVICQLLDGVRAKGCHFGDLLDAPAIQSRVPYLRWKAVSSRHVPGCVSTNELAGNSSELPEVSSDLEESVVLHSAGVCAQLKTIRHDAQALLTQTRAINSQFSPRETDVIYFSGTLAAPSVFSLIFAGALLSHAPISFDDPSKPISPLHTSESDRPVILFAETRDMSLTAEELLNCKGARTVILTDVAVTEDRVNLIRRATDANVFSVYCCAEACGFLTVNSSPGLWPSESAGVAVPGAHVVTLDTKGLPIHGGSVGKIAFRFSDSENSPWIPTGDWGRFDENGLLYIVGCERSVIWKAGFPVFAAEVEEALCSINGVKDAWVFGIPDREVGEEVTAQIAISDAALTIQSLLEKASGTLAAYKLPHEPLFVQELPTTPSGKKIRRTGRITPTSSYPKPSPAPAQSGPNLAPISDSADSKSATQS